MRDNHDGRNEVLATSQASGGGPACTARLLTVQEAAAALRTSRSSIYRLFDAGELCWARVCGKRRITGAEIDRFIAAHTEAAS
jgi:excisionase family DNA binding protein